MRPDFSLMSRRDVAETMASLCSFVDFEWGGCTGLWRIEGEACTVLAIEARQQGRGECRRFLGYLMSRYQIVRFLHVRNPILEAALLRRGFVTCGWFLDGEWVEGMRWRKA